MMNKITKEYIENIMEKSEFETTKHFGKTTIVTMKLPNGFTITESSSCVDKANYDLSIGTKICLERIKNRLYELEGYLLQNKLYGGNE